MCKSLSDSVTPVVYYGTAGASSKWSTDHSTQNAFDREDPNARWASKAGFPGKIWFQFTSEVKVVKISFSSVDGEWRVQSPKAFHVIASGDCSNWDTLLSVTNSGFTGPKSGKVLGNSMYPAEIISMLWIRRHRKSRIWQRRHIV